jgi:hypothetical protein
MVCMDRCKVAMVMMLHIYSECYTHSYIITEMHLNFNLLDNRNLVFLYFCSDFYLPN